jgi:DNA-binding IclR family transcriptional regulator
MNILDVASPYLLKLSQLLNETVVLAIYDGRDAVVTETFHSNNPLRVIPDEGSDLPLHATSLGKIILAGMADEDIDQHFEDKPLTHDTPYTITNLYDLKKEIETIRKEGFALDKEECIPDVSSISASLKSFDKSSIVAAIGIIGPTVRLTDDREI